MSTSCASLTHGIAEPSSQYTVVLDQCPQSGPLPLTNVRADLDAYIAGLEVDGATSGHQGLAWGWYLLSEHWAPHLPVDSAPASYSDDTTIKALILMTDGVFSRWHTDFLQGTADDQARLLCDNIRSTTDIRVFAIAFNAPTEAKALMEHCATEPSYVYDPDTAEDLATAYLDIARSLSDLRISS